eukprot:scaffold5921_cov255-Prasinococcus_capsulatus_cf.AAC.1
MFSAAHSRVRFSRGAPRAATVPWLLSLAVLSAKLGCRARHHSDDDDDDSQGSDRCYTAAPSDGLGGE